MNDVSFQIKRVKDISFNINERLYTHITTPVNLTLESDLSYNVEANAIILNLGCFYYYPDTPEDKLATITVQNIFEIKDLGRFVSEKQIFLPTDFMVTLMSISISHTRALLTKNLAGTVFQDRIIPIINPVDVTRQLFKYMFDREQENNRQVPVRKKKVKKESK